MKAVALSMLMICVGFCSSCTTSNSRPSYTSKPSGPVESIVVKKIKNSSMGGTWRYFFRVKNPENTYGAVDVDIRYTCPAMGSMRFRTVHVDLTGGLYTTFYVDHPVAPYYRGDHAEYGIQSFHFEVSKNKNMIYSCDSPVSRKYENATGY